MYQIRQPPGRRNSVGILNSQGEVAKRSDVQLYLERYRRDASAAGAADAFTVERIAGGEDRQTPNTSEQMKDKKGYVGALDAQTVLGISWPLPMVTYNVDGDPPFLAIPPHRENGNKQYLA